MAAPTSTVLSPLAFPIQTVAPSLKLSPYLQGRTVSHIHHYYNKTSYIKCVSCNMILPPYISLRAQIFDRPEVYHP